MDIKEAIDILTSKENIDLSNHFNNTKFFEAINILLNVYEKEKEKNKNKDKILQNIREEFLKYDWKNANPIQTYNQLKNLYESIYCKPYEE